MRSSKQEFPLRSLALAFIAVSIATALSCGNEGCRQLGGKGLGGFDRPVTLQAKLRLIRESK